MSYQQPDTPRVVAVSTLAGVVGAVALSLVAGAQVAVLVMAGACFLGAAARIALPVGRSFAVRRRAIDVGILLVFGAALAFLGLTAPL
ncbi:DUF3017 domain-containing protein [Demequina sp. NBRC 110054]|uniref:DUF3017 domain-containing protein n=1 Tax=Demequina sp. NBRC 110054 TaxID=1570343 RepID=UPI000A027A65|nr:DUF3017 domain-containing protein [Demequina sp. NBRC 110054]